MDEILAAIGILAISSIIVMLIKAYADDNEQAKKDFDFCYNCRCGWCDAIPDSKECKERMAKEGNNGG